MLVAFKKISKYFSAKKLHIQFMVTLFDGAVPSNEMPHVQYHHLSSKVPCV